MWEFTIYLLYGAGCLAVLYVCFCALAFIWAGFEGIHRWYKERRL